MSLNPAILSERELDQFESKRDLAAELLESVQQMKAGKVAVVLSPAGGVRALKGIGSPAGTAPTKEPR
jgi:putative transcriptional regulator